MGEVAKMGKGDGKGDGKGGCNCFGGKVEDEKPQAPDPVGMDRGCTDILFLLAFIAFWVGMVICAGMGVGAGDPKRLLYFIDYKGRRCGDGALADYKYTHFTHWQNSMSNVCVKSCPGPNVEYELVPSANSTAGAAVSVTTGSGCNYIEKTGVSQTSCLTTYASCLNVLAPGSMPSANRKCCVYGATGTAVGGTATTSATNGGTQAPNGMYFCVPLALQAGATNAMSAHLDGFSSKMNAAFGDLATGWWVILVALVVAFIVSFIWLNLLRFCAGCFVWSAIILSIVMSLALTAGCYLMYDKYKKEFDEKKLANDEQNMYMYLIALCVCGALSLVLLCLTIFLCKQIVIAVGIIKEACLAVNSMKMIVLFPIVQYLIMIVFLVYWIIIAIYMASTGDLKKGCATGTSGATCVEVYSMEYNDTMKKVILYHFFGLLWNMAFIRHMTILIIAGAIGSWYFTPVQEKEAGNWPTAPVIRSVTRSLRYHIGTVAFGSFIIAVIQFIRAVLAYIKKKFKEDKCMKCLITYIECCMACFERLMEFLSRNAYIVTACKGKNFCSAAWDSFQFIWNNLGQVSAVNWVSAYIMLLGKGFIVGGTVAVCFYIAKLDTSLASPWVLLVLCAVLAYIVACVFLGVFETAIDTILVCFCWEQDAGKAGGFVNAEGTRVVFATDTLNTFIDGAQGAIAAQSAEKKVEVQPADTQGAPLEGQAEK